MRGRSAEIWRVQALRDGRLTGRSGLWNGPRHGSTNPPAGLGPAGPAKRDDGFGLFLEHQRGIGPLLAGLATTELDPLAVLERGADGKRNHALDPAVPAPLEFPAIESDGLVGTDPDFARLRLERRRPLEQ